MGRYTNVDVSSMTSSINNLIREFENRKKNYDDIQKNLNNSNYFESCAAAKKGANLISQVVSQAPEGNINKVIKQLEKIKKGLEHIKKVQELEKQYKVAQRTTQLLEADKNNIIDKTALQMAKANESKLKLQISSEEKAADAVLT